MCAETGMHCTGTADGCVHTRSAHTLVWPMCQGLDAGKSNIASSVASEWLLVAGSTAQLAYAGVHFRRSRCCVLYSSSSSMH